MHIKLAIFNYLFPLQYDIISITTAQLCLSFISLSLPPHSLSSHPLSFSLGQGLLSPHDSSSLQKTGGGIGGKGRGGRKKKLAVELKEEAITHQSPSIPPPNIICTSKMQQCYYSSNPPTLITAPFPPRTRFSEPTAGPNKPGGGLTTSYPAFHHQYPLTHYPHPPRLYHPRVELLFPPATVPQDAHHKVGYPFSSQFLSWSPSLMKSSISPGVCSSVSGDVWTPSPSFYSSPLTQQCSYGVFPQEPLN